MSGLGEVVRALAERDGVQAVVLLSGDGLPIEHAGSGLSDPDAVAALAASLAQHAARFGEAAGRGRFATAVLEHEGGLAVLARVGRGEWLALLAASDADLGPLLYDLRRHRPALAELL